jgi:hypothetical protein
MYGKHNFEALAEVMCGVIRKFELEDKITRIVTDNGSNYVKAFRIFGSKGQRPHLSAEDLDEVEENLSQMLLDPKPTKDNNEMFGMVAVEDCVDTEAMEQDSPIEDEEISAQETLEPDEQDKYIELFDELTLNKEAFPDYVLPGHQRCASHTLNLIASADIAPILAADGNYQKAVIQKAVRLWAAQSKSAGKKEIIYKLMHRQLVTPAATRWNSWYDSLRFLQKLHDAPETR